MKAAAALAVMACVPVLVGCGSDDSDSATTDPPMSTTAGTTTPPSTSTETAATSTTTTTGAGRWQNATACCWTEESRCHGFPGGSRGGKGLCNTDWTKECQHDITCCVENDATLVCKQMNTVAV